MVSQMLTIVKYVLRVNRVAAFNIKWSSYFFFYFNLIAPKTILAEATFFNELVFLISTQSQSARRHFCGKDVEYLVGWVLKKNDNINYCISQKIDLLYGLCILWRINAFDFFSRLSIRRWHDFDRTLKFWNWSFFFSFTDFVILLHVFFLCYCYFFSYACDQNKRIEAPRSDLHVTNNLNI